MNSKDKIHLWLFCILIIAILILVVLEPPLARPGFILMGYLIIGVFAKIMGEKASKIWQAIKNFINML